MLNVVIAQLHHTVLRCGQAALVVLGVLLSACGDSSADEPEAVPTRRQLQSSTPASPNIDATGRSTTFPDSWNSIEGAAAPPGGNFEAPDPASVEGRFQPPLELWTTTLDRYGDPRRDGLMHGGIDIGLSGRGGSPLRAVCAGTVAEVGANDSYGQFVTLDCGDGWTAILGFVGELRVANGARVTHSTVVAISDPTGSHTHLELRHEGTAVNPANYMALPVEPILTPTPGPSPTVTPTLKPGTTAAATSAAGTIPAANTAPAGTPTPQPTATITPTQAPQPTPTRTPTRTPTAIRPATATPPIPIFR